MALDLRVQKTRENIQQQFLKLLKEYPFQDITVKQLILECRINRSTFYRNYEDKYDLIQQITQEMLDKFSRSLRPEFVTLPELDEHRLRPYFSPMLDFFQEARPALLVLTARQLPIDILGDMHRTFSSRLLEQLEKHYCLKGINFSAAAYFSRIISSNILTAIQWMHEESPGMSREEMLRLISTTVTMGIFSSMEQQFSRG